MAPRWDTGLAEVQEVPGRALCTGWCLVSRANREEPRGGPESWVCQWITEKCLPSGDLFCQRKGPWVVCRLQDQS